MARDWRGAGFAALYAKAGLPPALLEAFRAALSARRAVAQVEDMGDARLSRSIIARVIAACEQNDDAQNAALVAVLRRFDAEAAREEARGAAKFIFAPQVEAPVVVAIEQMEFGAAPRLITIDLEAIEAEVAVEVEKQAA
jgi:hypothetical protein